MTDPAMAREHLNQSWVSLIHDDLSDDSLMTLHLVFAHMQASVPAVQADQIAYNYGYISAEITNRNRAKEAAAFEQPEDPDAVPDHFEGGTFADHQWVPLTGDPDCTRCGYASRVEGIEHAITCELPLAAAPHQKWIKSHPQAEQGN